VSDQPVTLAEVERLIATGVSVDTAEPLIDRLPVDSEEKSALWLRAWCKESRQEERRAVPGLYLG